MLRPRLIPILLLDNGRLVKTTGFRSPTYVGDPLNVIRIFNEKEVDELIILDITASTQGREPDFELIELLASECFMPLTYGGAVRNAEDASRLFASGIEKVSIKSAAEKNTQVYSELANRFGSQAIVASIDVIQTAEGYSLSPDHEQTGDKSPTWINRVKQCIDAGVGEVLLTSVDREGTMQGIDLKLVALASEECSVPLIINGGLKSMNDVREGLYSGADAVAGGSFFVFHGRRKAVLISYPNVDNLRELET